MFKLRAKVIDDLPLPDPCERVNIPLGRSIPSDILLEREFSTGVLVMVMSKSSPHSNGPAVFLCVQEMPGEYQSAKKVTILPAVVIDFIEGLEIKKYANNIIFVSCFKSKTRFK